MLARKVASAVISLPSTVRGLPVALSMSTPLTVYSLPGIRPVYQTLQEAEQIARDFVSGKKVDYVYENMEEDGFHYEGAAVFDVQERQWLFVEGYFPVLEGDKELPYLPYKIEDTPAQSQSVQEQSPTVRELYEKYKAMVTDALENDQPYRNPWAFSIGSTAVRCSISRRRTSICRRTP